ncbi:MAG TPA: hypothetical protein VEB21_20715 [Terriglobales bacterium]|nr:hypothetical protein [Terriglobales bacterium]
MPDDMQDGATMDAHEALRVLDEARGRLRTAIWALHGMHQDMSVLTADDLSDIEHMLTELLETAINPSFDAISDLLGSPGSSGTVTTH